MGIDHKIRPGGSNVVSLARVEKVVGASMPIAADKMHKPNSRAIQCQSHATMTTELWDTLNRLQDQGLINDPANKAKSINLTEEGLRESKQLFDRYLRFAPIPTYNSSNFCFRTVRSVDCK
jgi:hypothetical protein